MVQTVNTTSATALRKYLLKTKAHVVLAQKIGTDIFHQPILQAWALANSWHSVLAPSLRGPTGESSAGAAIFARDFLGMRAQCPGILVPNRMVVAAIKPPGWPTIRIGSAYLHASKGLNADNLAIPVVAGRFLEKGGPAILGAHWQMTTSAIHASGFAQNRVTTKGNDDLQNGGHRR